MNSKRFLRFFSGFCFIVSSGSFYAWFEKPESENGRMFVTSLFFGISGIGLVVYSFLPDGFATHWTCKRCSFKRPI
jgi:hypothetical protein